jgi:hypothetical protein
MSNFIDTLPVIPPDDILLEYTRADEATKKAVTAMLRDQSVRWVIGTVNLAEVQRVAEGQRSNMLGIGMYKSENDYVPQLVSNVLSGFAHGTSAFEASLIGVCSWIARGGDTALQRVRDMTQGIINGQQSV